MTLSEIINKNLRGNYSSDTSIRLGEYIGDSTVTEYVPFYAPFEYHSEELTLGDNRKLLYYFPYYVNASGTRKGYSYLFQYLSQFGVFQRWKGVPSRHLRAMKGVIIEVINLNQIKIHLLLTIKPEYIWSIDWNKIDYSMFTLFVSSEITSNKDFKSMYSKLKKEYIDVLVEKGVDVIQTSDIKSWVFKSRPKKRKFKTISKMKEYLDNFNQLIYE